MFTKTKSQSLKQHFFVQNEVFQEKSKMKQKSFGLFLLWVKILISTMLKESAWKNLHMPIRCFFW